VRNKVGQSDSNGWPSVPPSYFWKVTSASPNWVTYRGITQLGETIPHVVCHHVGMKLILYLVVGATIVGLVTVYVLIMLRVLG
jgi:hypothetical protein